jgi:hypothetical protein
MVATLAGSGALLFGLALLLLPLLATELSRPGDSAWGALVLVLALVLVTSAERLSGSPMLAVICGGLLVGRLTLEVGHGRWRQLTPEEQGRLGTRERWSSSLHQASLALQGLLTSAGQRGSALWARWRERRPAKGGGKRWVRPEAAAADPLVPEVIDVSDFAEIDALLQAAPKDAPEEAVPPAAVLDDSTPGERPDAPAPTPVAETAGSEADAPLAVVDPEGGQEGEGGGAG